MLLRSLVAQQLMLPYVLSDGSLVNQLWLVGSCLLVSFWLHAGISLIYYHKRQRKEKKILSFMKL